MTTGPTELMAGEPVGNLAATIGQVDITHGNDGAMRCNARLEGETGTSLLRAVERYGADFAAADAFPRIVAEPDDLIGRENPS